MKNISDNEAVRLSQLYVRSLVSDILGAHASLDGVLEQILKVEDIHQISIDEIKVALVLSVFGADMVGLSNIFSARSAQTIMKSSIIAIQHELGISEEFAQKYIQQAKASLELIERTGEVSYVALPLMIQLKLGSYKELEEKLMYSMDGHVYTSLITQYVGKWKKIKDLYLSEK